MIIPLKPRAGTLVDRSLAGAPTGAFYLFADGPNAPAADACGGPAAVPTGGVALGPGRFGPAALFNGTTGFYDGGDGDGVRNLTLGPFTIAGWINPANLSAAVFVAQKRNSGGTAGWQFFVNSTGTLRLALFTTGTGTAAVSAGVVPVGQWTHVAGVFDGVQAPDAGHLTLYLNGVRQGLIVDQAGTGVFGIDTGQTLRLGVSKTGANFFNGAIDHLLVDRRAYGAAEIAALYASPFRNFLPTLALLQSATAAKGAVTRLGLDGYGVKRTGSFAGKIPSVGGSIMPWPLFERMVA